MQLAIFPEIHIQFLYEPHPDEILISIREPHQVDLIPHGTFAAIYHLKIYDLAESVVHPQRDSMPAMSLEHAIDLLHFVCQYWPTHQRFTIHCAAGISRSPAVAMALSELFKGTPSSTIIRQRHPHFNPHVYQLILQAARTCSSYAVA